MQGCPEKLHLAWKPGIIFQSLEFLKNKMNFLISMGMFTNFDKYMGQKSANFVFYDVKNQNLRPNFTAAQKNIFRKDVTMRI